MSRHSGHEPNHRQHRKHTQGLRICLVAILKNLVYPCSMKKLLIVLSLATLSASGKEMIPTPPDYPVIGELENWLHQKMVKAEGSQDANLSSVNQEDYFKAVVKKNNL